MKRVLVAAMCLMLAVGICGCGNTTDTEPTKTVGANAVEEQSTEQTAIEDTSEDISENEIVESVPEPKSESESESVSESQSQASNFVQPQKPVKPDNGNTKPGIQKDESAIKVDKAVAEVMEAEGFEELSQAEQAKKVLDVLYEMEKEGLVLPDTISCGDDNMMITFQYKNGLYGTFVLGNVGSGIVGEPMN